MSPASPFSHQSPQPLQRLDFTPARAEEEEQEDRKEMVRYNRSLRRLKEFSDSILYWS